jgi:signal transduction histidine kinase
MRISLVILLLLLHLHSSAQKQGRSLMDSLLLSIPSAPNDTVKARIYNRLANFYSDVNADTALFYAAKGMQVAQSMQWQKGISAFHLCYGNIYSNRGLLDSSLRRYRLAQDISIALRDTVNMAINYNNMGGVANAKSDFVLAAAYFTETLKLGLAARNTYSIGLACENLSLVYFNQNDYQKALNFGRQSLDAYEKGRHTELKQSALHAIGNAFREMKQFDSALVYFEKSLLVSRRNNNKMEEAAALNGLAQFYASREDYKKALEYSLASKKIWDATGPSFEEAINNTGFLGTYYLQLAKQSKLKNTNTKSAREVTDLLEKARFFLTEAVNSNGTAGNRVAETEFRRNLAEVYALSGNFAAAYQNVVSYQDIKDSIFSQENKNKIAAAISQLEIDKKNREITINQLTISSQRRQRIFYLVGLLLMAIIGTLFYRQSLLRKRTNESLVMLNKELDEANKVKAQFFAILSHDLRAPIANLLAFLRLQKEEPGGMTAEQAATGKQKITHATEALIGNMEAMLLWSKGQMRNFRPVIKSVPVQVLFSFIADFFKDTENAALNIANAEGISISTDEDYLRAIMQNLTANALKVLGNTPGARIVWDVSRNETGITLSISDNGPGMKPAELAAFYSNEPVANRKYGFGLYMVRELAKSVGCVVTCESIQPTGTKFTLAFSKPVA